MKEPNNSTPKRSSIFDFGQPIGFLLGGLLLSFRLQEPLLMIVGGLAALISGISAVLRSRRYVDLSAKEKKNLAFTNNTILTLKTAHYENLLQRLEKRFSIEDLNEALPYSTNKSIPPGLLAAGEWDQSRKALLPLLDDFTHFTISYDLDKKNKTEFIFTGSDEKKSSVEKLLNQVFGKLDAVSREDVLKASLYIVDDPSEASEYFDELYKLGLHRKDSLDEWQYRPGVFRSSNLQTRLGLAHNQEEQAKTYFSKLTKGIQSSLLFYLFLDPKPWKVILFAPLLRELSNNQFGRFLAVNRKVGFPLGESFYLDFLKNNWSPRSTKESPKLKAILEGLAHIGGEKSLAILKKYPPLLVQATVAAIKNLGHREGALTMDQKDSGGLSPARDKDT